MGAQRGERALREAVWWVAALAVAAGAVVLFGGHVADSFGSTWAGVGAGADSLRSGSAVAVWDGARGAVVPRSPIPLRVAATTNLPAGAWAAFLVLVWIGGTRSLALALGARPGTAAACGLAAGLLVLSASGGRIVVLEAAAYPWLLGAVLGRAGALRTTASLLLLGLLSPEGIRLALPVLLVDALLRSDAGWARWVPAGLGAACLWVIPEPEWARFLRFEAPRSFTAGPWAWPARNPGEALSLVVGEGGGVTAASLLAMLALPLAALAGAAHARARGGAAVLVTLGLLGVALGERGAAPASLLALVFPAARVHPLPDVAALTAGPVMLALAARAPAATFAVLGALLPVLAADVSPRTATGAVPASIASAIAAGPGETLTLPMTIENDRRWRLALPATPRLRNGTQEVLAANAPLLARELAEAEPRHARDLLRRLGVSRVVAAPARAAALGTVEIHEGGEALARLPDDEPPDGSPPCLAPEGWALRSSVGNPEVGVPGRAIDGDPATRWGTGGPQAPGQFFEIDFGRSLALERIELRHERFGSDFPRGFRVLAAGGDAPGIVFRRDPYLGEAAWRDGFRYETPDGIVRIPLGGAVQRLRIELTRRSRLHDWSIATICAVEATEEEGSARR